MHFPVKLLPILISPQLDCIWINIPKNASSFMQKILQDNGWREPDSSIRLDLLNSSIRKLCIFRNPVERWISGFAECFMDMPEIIDLLDTPAFIKVVERSPIFDNHTELQSTFIINSTNLEYIHLRSVVDASRFFTNVEQWIKENGGQADCGRWQDPINPSSNDEIKHMINKKLKKIVEQNTSLRESLDNFFSPDVVLINKAKRINYGG